MLDFIKISQKSPKRGTLNVYPEFIVNNSKDLMIRGGRFYAVWDEQLGLWSKSETRAMELIDAEVINYVKQMYNSEDNIVPLLLRNYSSRKWTEWQNYCKSLPDNYQELDTNIIFENVDVKKKDYATRKLPYAILEGDLSAYEELMDTLYSQSDRRKIEWLIGSIISGDSKKIQKFGVFYGGPGTGKSTVLNIIEKLFPGYYSMFESKALGSANSAFALESFASNPLIAIEHDGDLSKIEDNTKLNSIVSHETMVVNEKFKSKYTTKFNSIILMGTNKPVRITDAKSGLLRRLIDIVPTGNTIPKSRYDYILSKIDFELGAIAHHCLQVYNELGINYYNGYIPKSMMSTTNDFYNFVEDNFDFFNDGENGSGYITLNVAWMRYNEYVADSRVAYPFQKRIFKEELKNYFSDFKQTFDHKSNVYFSFLSEKFDYKPEVGWDDEREADKDVYESWLKFDSNVSLFDEIGKKYPAQYATDAQTPEKKWSYVKTKLEDIDTSKLHYVKVPENHIVIDFDIRDENGEKSYEKNLEAASKWPKTYAELSKSGSGIHLHYIYGGLDNNGDNSTFGADSLDVSKLSRIYDEDIEIKVFTGNSSLRRMLTKCNDIPISTISSGLPLKGERPVLQDITIKSERDLRNRIARNLRKEIHPSTKCSMDFIHKLLDEAYEQGLKYDVRDMRPDIQQFALNSTHQASNCLKLINSMHFCSDEPTDNTENYEDNRPIIFFDMEVFPNLLIVCWKKLGKDSKVIKMINPSPEEIEKLIKFKLVGFNNRKYDNHILYARMMGYSEKQLFELSRRIITDKDRDAFFGEAYNLSYTDIYDFLSAANKMSLKKWEIKLKIHHMELGLPWDKPVPKELWQKVADYCANDVIATEAVWDANQADWLARKILSLLSGLTVNDTTNNHTTKIIVGNDKNPQSQFIYTDLSTIFPGYEYNQYGIDRSRYLDEDQISSGKSIYMGWDPSEGGFAWGNPGIYVNAALLDVVSMHPHSAIALNIFGDEYTKRFSNLVEARVYIKHEDYEEAKKMLETILYSLDQMGILDEYLNDPEKAKALADALKTAINSVYGLTSASFPNKLRDPRNKDNIVAKYGALFMITLKHEVEKLGYTVIHIKTDSIKIANADQKIIDFVMKFGEKYGYTFEHEDTYSKMCIVNDAVYIARYAKPHIDKKTGKEIWWTATGTQFQIPYVFKTLFSHETIEFEDMCETKSVSSALYLDFNERKDPEGLGFVGEEFHDYRYVGKVGLFCPIKPGCGGGVLLREDGKNPGKFHAATGTKKQKKVSKDEPDMYYWMEAEMVEKLGNFDDIDRSYYNQLVDDAIETISKYGDFEWFSSDNVVNDISWMEIPDTDKEELPFDDFPMNKPIAA